MIAKRNSILKGEFDIKDLGAANKTLNMEIVRDQEKHILYLSQEMHI